MDVEILIDQLRLRMEWMTGIERIEVIDDLMEGYCHECGDPIIGRACYCAHDE